MKARKQQNLEHGCFCVFALLFLAVFVVVVLSVGGASVGLVTVVVVYSLGIVPWILAPAIVGLLKNAVDRHG